VILSKIPRCAAQMALMRHARNVLILVSFPTGRYHSGDLGVYEVLLQKWILYKHSVII